MTPGSPRDKAHREIHDLHVFFEAWFCGRLEAAEFSRLEQAIASDFVMISPNGVRTTRDPLLAALRDAHGRYLTGGFQIETRNPDVRVIDDRHLFGTYEEWQQKDGSWSGRVSTVLFEIDPGGALRWLHVHETALP